MKSYTAISFAPVQGFIEKSRKLRDLFGASLILSYLSYRLVQEAEERNLEVISPGLIKLQEEMSNQKGMPNRILIKGNFSRDDVAKTLTDHWKKLLAICKEWVEKNIPHQEKQEYHWDKEWQRLGMYTWEVFWGQGNCTPTAMQDLETRKLRRNWTGINWIGESSSLTGADAIAWPGLGKKDSCPGRPFTQEEKKEIKDFYERLSYALDQPANSEPVKEPPKDAEWEGKYLSPKERLSLPELAVRLVTRDDIAEEIGIDKLNKGFKEIARIPDKTMEKGRWTGWFMGDGDKIGYKIKKIARTKGDEGVKIFSNTLRSWGETFYQEFPKKHPGRVIYAGGDEFLGVLYKEKQEPELKAKEILSWLEKLPETWQDLQEDLPKKLALEQEDLEKDPKLKMTFSVGFVWAAHGVPQRDVLQHCRKAQESSKKRGRDRLTIRVLFNSGQHVEWTCPWDYLHILHKYCDRDPTQPLDREEGHNWSHIYTDLADLKARHAIDFKSEKVKSTDLELALALFDIYFNKKNQEQDEKESKYLSRHRQHIVGKFATVAEENKQIIYWIRDLIEVGWQLLGERQ